LVIVRPYFAFKTPVDRSQYGPRNQAGRASTGRGTNLTTLVGRLVEDASCLTAGVVHVTNRTLRHETKTKKGKKASAAATVVAAAPTTAGGMIDPSASAFTALDEWEKRRAAAAGIEPPTSESDSDDSNDGFSTVVRKKNSKQQQQQNSGSNGAIAGAAGGTDGAFGWAPVYIPGQPMPKKPKAPRAPRPSVADCGAALTAPDLKGYLTNLEREYPGMNHLVFFGDYIRKAFEKADAVALNKLVATVPIAAAAEQPLNHVPNAVVTTATQWLAKRDFDDVSTYAATIVSQLGDPEPSSAASTAAVKGGGGKGGAAASSASNAPPTRPTAGLLVTIALVLRAVPGALNPPAAAEKRLMNPKQSKLSKPECAPMLAWVVAQACAGNAAAGLGLWSRTMLPLALDAAAKRGTHGGKSTNAEREETQRLAAALSEHLTGTAAARRRLSGAAAAMSVDTGVHPSAVDLLLRAGDSAPAAMVAMLSFLSETCRAPNGAQRAAGVAAEMWPIAAMQAAGQKGVEFGLDVVKAAGLDSLTWCVGAAAGADVRTFLPQLCQETPEVGRDVLRRVGDCLEGRDTLGTGLVAGGKSGLMKKKTSLSEAVADIREKAAKVVAGGAGGVAWREVDAAAKRVERIVGVGPGGKGGVSGFSDAVHNVTVVLAYPLLAVLAAAALVSYMTSSDGAWALEKLLAAVPGDSAAAVNGTVFRMASEVEGARGAVEAWYVGFLWNAASLVRPSSA
jgi:hypothetical protein